MEARTNRPHQAARLPAVPASFTRSRGALGYRYRHGRWPAALLVCGMVLLGCWSGHSRATEPASVFRDGPLAPLFDAPHVQTAPGLTAPSAGLTPAARASGPFQQAQSLAQAMARRFPEGRRAAVQEAYVKSMNAYRELQAQQGWPDGDLSGALAAFVAGNYAMWRDVDVPGSQFLALAAQLRRNPATQAWLRSHDDQAQRNLFERLAMEGTFMALLQDQRLKAKAAAARGQAQPAAAEYVVLQALAESNLARLLPGRASRLRLGEQGLSLAAEPGHPAAASVYR